MQATNATRPTLTTLILFEPESKTKNMFRHLIICIDIRYQKTHKPTPSLTLSHGSLMHSRPVKTKNAHTHIHEHTQ